MADYWVDDGGDNSTGTSWATAYTSIANLISAVPSALTTAGNRIFIGHDHSESASGNITYTLVDGPGQVFLISADRTDTGAVPATLASSTDQVACTGFLILDGGVSAYGVRFKCNTSFIRSDCQSDEVQSYYGCTFAVPSNGSFVTSGLPDRSRHIFEDCVIDLTSDGSSNRSGAVFTASSLITIKGLSFINAAYRTGTVFSFSGSYYCDLEITGSDFSGFTNGTPCELFAQESTAGRVVMSNCLTTDPMVALDSGTSRSGSSTLITNSGPENEPAVMLYKDWFGQAASSSIYRTGGAVIESGETSWLVTTTARVTEGALFKTPWIYGTIDSTGSKTFDCYITNDDADFDDDEVWLEVEYLGTSGEAIWALASDQRTTITTTPAAQTDDTASTWNGAGPSYTYKQKLSVTATVNVTGQYRARVCVGVASIASSRYFHIDPKITVS